MRQINVIERPWSAPSAALCLSSVSELPVLSAPAPVVAVPVAPVAPVSVAPVGAVALLTVESAPISQEHQVRVQAEPARKLFSLDGINGVSGLGGGSALGMKRYTDSTSGVPPRGRPV